MSVRVYVSAVSFVGSTFEKDWLIGYQICFLCCGERFKSGSQHKYYFLSCVETSLCANTWLKSRIKIMKQRWSTLLKTLFIVDSENVLIYRSIYSLTLFCASRTKFSNNIGQIFLQFCFYSELVFFAEVTGQSRF